MVPSIIAIIMTLIGVFVPIITLLIAGKFAFRSRTIINAPKNGGAIFAKGRESFLSWFILAVLVGLALSLALWYQSPSFESIR